SGTTDAVHARTDTVAHARPATVAPARPTAVVPTPIAKPTQTPQVNQYALESIAGLRPHNVTVEPATHAGKLGVRVAISDEARRRLQQMSADEQAKFDEFVVLEGTDFAN